MEKSIGLALKSARIEKGLKAVYVARKLKISPSTLSKYENDERRVPAKLLPEFARMYSCDVNYFFENKIGESPTKSA